MLWEGVGFFNDQGVAIAAALPGAVTFDSQSTGVPMHTVLLFQIRVSFSKKLKVQEKTLQCEPSSFNNTIDLEHKGSVHYLCHNTVPFLLACIFDRPYKLCPRPPNKAELALPSVSGPLVLSTSFSGVGFLIILSSQVSTTKVHTQWLTKRPAPLG